jgi:hypothetical protein
MSNCQLIVWERTSHWASVLRASLGAWQPQVVETRSLALCEAALMEAPASLVAVAVTPDSLEAVVGFLRRLSQRFPRATAVVLLALEVEAAAGLLREAGALDAIASVLDVPRLARLARRHHARAPKREMTLHEFVVDQMPWAAYATPSESA